jgi:16S rRNA (adenine1518-N6/adenine1519-N6)-dimethyltransferase
MHPKKALGQHFLHDVHVLNAIVSATEVTDSEQIYEIGPGTGRLTAKLLATVGADRLTCVEKDRDMIAHLSGKFPELKVLEGDARAFDWPSVTVGAVSPGVVVGNLPYNVSTVIYFDLLTRHRHLFRRFVMMFQREVAKRLLADAGSKTYGPPSVLTRTLADIRQVVKVSPRAFRPPPKVGSMVVQVDPLDTPRFGLAESEVAPFSTFVRSVFGQRRKTIRNNLKGVTSTPDDVLHRAGVDPSHRPEVLPPETLVRLWRNVIGE